MCSRKSNCQSSAAAKVYSDSIAHVEFAGMTRGQFPHGQECQARVPCEWIPICDGFRPLFRWLQDAIIPRNPARLDFLQPVPCAYADDFAVAAPSFRCLMTTLAPVFRNLDQIACLNLNHRCKMPSMQSSSAPWLGRKAMLIVGWHLGKIIQLEKNRQKKKRKASTQSLVERLCEIQICALSVLCCIGSICPPDDGTLKAEAHALQRTTAGPYNATTSNIHKVGSVCGLGNASNTLSQGLEKIQAAQRYDFVPMFTLHKTRSKRLPQPCSMTNFSCMILLGPYTHVLPESLDPSVAYAFRKSCLT